jgi:hypothetical protein
VTKFTSKQKVDHLAEAAIKLIRERATFSEAPILMVFSNPDNPSELRAIAAEDLDAKFLIEQLAASGFSRFQ